MSYVKISDPAIIDIAAWHQLIQVVNQHGDAIAAITNNFGSSLSITDTDGDNWMSTFDLGSQMIHFGRAKLTGVTSETVDFPLSFSAKPVVVAQLRTTQSERLDLVVTTRNVISSSFDVYVRKPAQTGGISEPALDPTIAADEYYNIDWIAIGPK